MQTATQVNPIEIINTVNSFYEVAWNHLLWFVGVAGAIIGVIVPFLIQLYQRRLFKVEEGNIKQELDKHVNQIKADLLKSIEGKIDDQVKRIDIKLSQVREEMIKEVAEAKGGVFFLQARNSESKKIYKDAVQSYKIAAENFLVTDSQYNLQITLKDIVDCLTHLTNEHFEHPDFKSGIDDLIKRLEEKNTSGRYAIFIGQLKSESEKARKREAPVSPAIAPP